MKIFFIIIAALSFFELTTYNLKKTEKKVGAVESTAAKTPETVSAKGKKIAGAG